MQELERVKLYIRKVNAAEQVPTDRTPLSVVILTPGNLVVDKPAAQRMILHSIPKKQIVPDPGPRGHTSESSSSKSQRKVSAGQKRHIEQSSSHESSSVEGEVRPSKRSKRKNCKFLLDKRD